MYQWRPKRKIGSAGGVCVAKRVDGHGHIGKQHAYFGSLDGGASAYLVQILRPQ